MGVRAACPEKWMETHTHALGGNPSTLSPTDTHTRPPAPAVQALQQERGGLLAEAAAHAGALAELDAEVAAAEGELGRNPHKSRALELQARARLIGWCHVCSRRACMRALPRLKAARRRRVE